MKKFGIFLLGLLIVFGTYYACLFFINSMHIPFPAPILGILVLFILLQTKLLPADLVKDFCSCSLKFMTLFFIPLFVGIIKYLSLIYQNLLPIVITIFITTFLIMVSVGLTFQYALKYTRLYKMKRGKE